MRLPYVLIRDLEDDRKSLITYIVTIVGIIAASAIIDGVLFRYFHNQTEDTYTGLFYGFLFLGGMIFTSLMFHDDLYSRIKNHQFLMLPADPFEKFFSRALITAVIYPLALTLLFTVTSLILEPLFYLIFRQPMELFNPFTRSHIISYFHYLTVSSVFFLGSIYFRKVHFFKTIISVLGILFSFSLFGMLFMRLFFASFFRGWELSQEFQLYFSSGYAFPYGTWEIVGNIIYFALLPLFCYTAAYFRLKEVEATDAIQ